MSSKARWIAGAVIMTGAVVWALASFASADDEGDDNDFQCLAVDEACGFEGTTPSTDVETTSAPQTTVPSEGTGSSETTVPPTTVPSTTVPSTTVAPTTAAPTTAVPTTLGPSTTDGVASPSADEPPATLPRTGGLATSLLTVAGMLLASGLVLVTHQRRLALVAQRVVSRRESQHRR